MVATTERTQLKKMPAPGRLELDEAAIDVARRSLEPGAPQHTAPWRKDIVKLLNDSLATELVCVLRYKRHHFTADGLASPKDLKAMIRANLVAERVAIESYSQLVALIGDKDSTTRRLIEEILGVEQQHAEELEGWLAD